MNIHEFLTDQGMYVHTHFDETWEDNGDGESGPMVTHCPAYDQYSGDSHYLFAEKGVIVHMEPRDIRFEQFVDEYFAEVSET